MPLWPSFAQVMDFAERSVRLSASGVRMSGRRAPFLIPMPTPERDGGAGAGVHLALLREVVDRGGGKYGEVEGFARFDLALQGGGEAEGDDELVPGLALEGGRELVQRLPDAVRSEDLDFGGADRSHSHESGEPGDC